jgi:hypothetical protein
MPDTPVVNNASLLCTGATAGSSTLTVTSQQFVKAGGQLVATIMDFAPGANIKPFGTCKILTAAASGVPTPCAPAVVAPWVPGSVVQKITGLPVLLKSCKAICAIGGEISILNPGQMVEKSD